MEHLLPGVQETDHSEDRLHDQGNPDESGDVRLLRKIDSGDMGETQLEEHPATPI